MRRLLITTLTAWGFVLTLLAGPVCAEENPVKAAEKLLEEKNVKTDAAALLEFFRHRTLTEAEQLKLEGLIKQLGALSFRTREQATAQLIARGPVAIELLKAALPTADLEMTRRIEQCLERIREKDQNKPQISTAAALLLRHRKPAGTVEVLLNYLPFADNDSVAEEVRLGLAELAVVDGKTDPVLVVGLTSKNPVLRAGAGEALARARANDQKQAVRALLKDPDCLVRARVGLALVLAGDREAMPVLVEHLADMPLTLAWQTEDILLRLAEGKNPPGLPVAGAREARLKARDAWLSWWKQYGGQVDLAELHKQPILKGYTTVVLLDKGEVLDLGENNQVRWRISGLIFPLDVQVLPGERVLVAEYHAQRVTERNLKGEILWQKRVNGPLAAQRLENGNTFIATDSELIEVDRTGEKEVWNHFFNNGERIMKAAKLANGDVVCLTTAPRVVRLDSHKKEIKTFPVNLANRLFGGRIHMLPNGRVLVPHNLENKVVEYDANGKAIWEVSIEQPIAAIRLPNGNTLVTTMTQNRAVEFNRTGTEVWQFRSDTRVTRALRR